MSFYLNRRFRPDTPAEAEKIRQQLKSTYGLLYEGLNDLLFRVDTHEVNFGDNNDEYERVVWEALADLESAKSDDEIEAVLEGALGRVLAEPLSDAARGRLRQSIPEVRDLLIARIAEQERLELEPE
jgi:hypothetical protein